MKLTVGSRTSELAMMQTKHVKKLLQQSDPDLEIDIRGISTKGTVIIIIYSRHYHKCRKVAVAIRE